VLAQAVARPDRGLGIGHRDVHVHGGGRHAPQEAAQPRAQRADGARRLAAPADAGAVSSIIRA
jgi:hypothetical protein